MYKLLPVRNKNECESINIYSFGIKNMMLVIDLPIDLSFNHLTQLFYNMTVEIKGSTIKQSIRFENFLNNVDISVEKNEGYFRYFIPLENTLIGYLCEQDDYIIKLFKNEFWDNVEIYYTNDTIGYVSTHVPKYIIESFNIRFDINGEYKGRTYFDIVKLIKQQIYSRTLMDLNKKCEILNKFSKIEIIENNKKYIVNDVFKTGERIGEYYIEIINLHDENEYEITYKYEKDNDAHKYEKNNVTYNIYDAHKYNMTYNDAYKYVTQLFISIIMSLIVVKYLIFFVYVF